MSLKVNTALKRPGIHTVSPIGSIDANTSDLLEKSINSILAQKPDVIIFDMAFTDYINSNGIRVLLKTKRALNARSGKQIFIHLQPQIKKVFDVLKALPAMGVFKNVAELDEYLDAIQKKANPASR